MKKYLKFLSRMILVLTVFVLLFQDAVMAKAEVVETELLNVETEGDFTVMFNYEADRPEIVFISPSGKEYAEGISSETELLSAHGEGWSTYKVIAAEPGMWKIRCDKKNNAYVECGFVEEVDGLCIQSFDIVSIQEERAVLNFDVSMGEEEVIEYKYTVSVILGEDTESRKTLASGRAYTGTQKEISVNLELSSYKGYRFLLEVTATQGLEMFDSMLSESFDYFNPKTPDGIEDVYVLLDMTNQKCELDWTQFYVGRNKEYHIVVFTNADTENPIYSNTTTNCTDVFYYPTGTEKIILNLYYKNNGILSEALVKEIDLVNGESLQIMTPEVTGSSQLELAYKNLNRTMLYVKVNEDSGSYNLMEPGTLYFPLQTGLNRVEAFFQGSNKITYYVSGDIYLDTTPPELMLYENFDGMTFQKSDVTIAGSAKNAAKLFVNETEVMLEENGTFAHTVSLHPGENYISVIAESMAGIRIQRDMKLLKEKNAATNGVLDYLPLLTSSVVSLFIAVSALLTLGRQNNRPAIQRYQRFAITIGIIVTLAEVACIVVYVYFYRFNNSRQYVELAKKSVVEAAKYLDYQRFALIAVCIMAAVLVINLAVGLIVKFVSKGKEKKNIETQE